MKERVQWRVCEPDSVEGSAIAAIMRDDQVVGGALNVEFDIVGTTGSTYRNDR